jgi:transposase
MAAAHVVFAPCLGVVWCVQRLCVNAPSGRQRLKVLAAINALTHDVFTVEHLTSITAATVGALWRQLAAAHQGLPSSVILDNARYQRCALVQAVAHEFESERLDLPTYSPNLNRIERFWRFVKQQCLYSKDYPASSSFQQAIFTYIQQASTTHKEEVKRW